MVENDINSKLENEFSPNYLTVENESHRHNVPPGSESHFKVVISSAQFEGLRSVKRHQLIYSTLQKEFDEGLHALALHTFTPEEWSALDNDVAASPGCKGGSNH
ncbi:BolA/IbaG family iron-sulfur metabolism protein [Vibrio sp. SS-MA-C1-2]|uniref:BolA/IbaG family iron-sulfur metabolism protein n=1 Tax=Vibrio sp. SS-MA-C1-2 TaxID=2908646 RepID=UPI001F185D7F|nr:BolA/IbaG family iron-sulfur metabolism protein [Vibrio sp. SS-MA-C1-2]UJF18841.1 BolA/IbaG family iron-sulfur metabolism protein [Vibrio sp. SS-MA-C1-2]